MAGEREQQVWNKAESFLVGASHNRRHSEQVIAYGVALQKIYGGDPEIIQLAGICHDLGRSRPDLKGDDSVVESVRLAGPILEQAGYPDETVAKVCEVIKDHDQPRLRPSTIEGRILKDADFLDGFGARGILRSLLWAGEKRSESLEEIIRRLREKMPARIAGLEFPESRRIARKEYRFVELFLSLLDTPSSLETEKLTGKYIIFEGTSGTGKETQARLLADKLEEEGKDVLVVYEPTPDAKPVLAAWREEVDDNFMDMLFYSADRVRIIEKKVLPALRAGKTVISMRSWISTLVYEAENDKERALISFLHTYVPEPELIFWFDIDPNLSMERINKRISETNEPLGKFEKLERLMKHRKKYEEVLKRFSNVVKIDASRTVGEVQKTILDALDVYSLGNK